MNLYVMYMNFYVMKCVILESFFTNTMLALNYVNLIIPLFESPAT